MASGRAAPDLIVLSRGYAGALSPPPASPTGDPADLVALMIAARDEWTPEVETEMLAAIGRTPLIVRTDTDPATGRQVVTLSLDPAGAPVAIAFTSIEELGRWAGDTPIEAGRVSGRDLARLAVASGATAMFIDPAS